MAVQIGLGLVEQALLYVLQKDGYGLLQPLQGQGGLFTGEKAPLPLEGLEQTVSVLLENVQQSLFDKAKANLDSHTWPAATVEEVKAKAMDGFVKTMWCGDTACEEKMKELAGVSSRCIPFAQEKLGDVCPCCGRPAKQMVIWGVAY